jgi:hypothetical protein
MSHGIIQNGNIVPTSPLAALMLQPGCNVQISVAVRTGVVSSTAPERSLIVYDTAVAVTRTCRFILAVFVTPVGVTAFVARIE